MSEIQPRCRAVVAASTHVPLAFGERVGPPTWDSVASEYGVLGMTLAIGSLSGALLAARLATIVGTLVYSRAKGLIGRAHDSEDEPAELVVR